MQSSANRGGFVQPVSSNSYSRIFSPSNELRNTRPGHDVDKDTTSPSFLAKRQGPIQLEESLLLEKQIAPAIAPASAPLRRRKKVLWILALHLPLQIIPWVLTCILNYRPLSVSTYVGQVGQYTPADFTLNKRWQTAIRVFNTISAVLTIPVTSLILGQAAVIYSHRRSNSSNLTLKQLCQLADKGWADPTVVLPEIFKRTSRRENMNHFLRFGFAFILLCA